MPWQFFILLSVIFYSFATLLQRILLKDNNSNPIAYSLVFQTLVGVILAATGLLLGRWQWPNFSLILPNFLLMLLLYAAGNVFIFHALKVVEVSKFTILFAIRGFITVIGSTIFLREGLTSIQFLGAGLIFAAIALVNFKAQQLKFNRGDLLALLAGLCFGLANTNDRFLLNTMDVYVFTSLGFLLPVILIGAVYPKEIPHIRLFLQPTLFKKMFIFSIFYSISAVTFFLALQKAANSSQIAAINLTSVILIVLFGIFFLKEKTDIAKKIAAAFISFLGLCFVGS
jgi:drug/metabolite transporter (DMT)-like permease